MSERLIDFNKRSHNKNALKYEKMHKEIYNEIEQDRLFNSLSLAKKYIEGKSDLFLAFDYGCGAGNLTRHLLKLGFDVTSADISENFLDLVCKRFNEVKPLQLNGKDISEMSSNTFDIVATYSVLHHVPDYLASVRELCRITKSGGVLYIDHENSRDYWGNIKAINEFKKKALNFSGRYGKYLNSRNYLSKIITMTYNKKYSREGDIHVFPDDFINWDSIIEILQMMKFKIIRFESFLCYNDRYKKEVYDRYKDSLNDTSFILAVKQ